MTTRKDDAVPVDRGPIRVKTGPGQLGRFPNQLARLGLHGVGMHVVGGEVKRAVLVGRGKKDRLAEFGLEPPQGLARVRVHAVEGAVPVAGIELAVDHDRVGIKAGTGRFRHPHALAGLCVYGVDTPVETADVGHAVNDGRRMTQRHFGRVDPSLVASGCVERIETVRRGDEQQAIGRDHLHFLPDERLKRLVPLELELARDFSLV